MRTRDSEKRRHRADGHPVVVDDVDQPPFVEGGAGVRDAAADQIADIHVGIPMYWEKEYLMVGIRGSVFRSTGRQP